MRGSRPGTLLSPITVRDKSCFQQKTASDRYIENSYSRGEIQKVKAMCADECPYYRKET